MKSATPVSRITPDPALLFIVGTPRSGTTLLYRLIQRHPAFLPHSPNPRLVESGYFRHPVPLKPSEARPMARFLGERRSLLRAYFHYLRNQPGNRFPARLSYPRLFPLLRGFPSGLLRALAWSATGLTGLAREYFRLAGTSRPGGAVVEKTPLHLYHSDEILTSFPHAVIVGLVRHPVDVYSSYRARLKRSQELGVRRPWLDIGVLRFCLKYRFHNRRLQRSVLRSHRVQLVRYEDLTQSPLLTLNAILKPLGLAYPESLLKEDGMRAPRHSAAEDPFLEKPVTRHTKDWREFLSETEAWVIEWLLAGHMRRLQFAPYTTPLAPLVAAKRLVRQAFGIE